MKKIQVALRASLLGLANQIEVRPANADDVADTLRKENPLGKLPVLIAEDGTTRVQPAAIANQDVPKVMAYFMSEVTEQRAIRLSHLGSPTFALGEGRRYADLVPDANLITPHETAQTKAYVGWAYCARTPARDFFLAYFEKDCPARSMIRGALPHASYRAQWFDPRTGQWSKAGDGVLKANQWGWLMAPNFPSADDWGLKLTARSDPR